MRKLIPILLFCISFNSSWAFSRFHKDTIPHNLDSLIAAELEFFDDIEWKNRYGENIVIEQIQNLSEVPPKDSYRAIEYDTSGNKDQIPIGRRYQAVHDLLMKPLQNGELGTEEFIHLFQSWGESRSFRSWGESRQNIISELAYKSWEPLESDDILFDWISSRTYLKVLIKSTHRPVQFKQEIIDAILHDCYEHDVKSKTENKVYQCFARINHILTDQEKLKLTTAIFDVLSKDKKFSLFTNHGFNEPIEWNIQYGSEVLKDSIENLLINYLSLNPIEEAYKFKHALYLLDTPKMAEYYSQRLYEISKIDVQEDYYENLFNFGRYYLHNYIRATGKTSLTLLETLLDDETQKVGKNYKNFDSAQEQTISGLTNLTRLNSLESSERTRVIKMMKIIFDSQGNKSSRDLAEIAKNLFPALDNSDLREKIKSLGFNHHISDNIFAPNKFNVDRLDEYLYYMESIGINISKFDNRARFQYVRDNWNQYHEFAFIDLLDKIGVIATSSFHEFGNYRQLADQYLSYLGEYETKVSIKFDLNNGHYYERSDYKIYAFDHKKGLRVSPDHSRYNRLHHNEFRALMNEYLETTECKERFISFSTLSSYGFGTLFIRPGQAKLITKKFCLDSYWN